MDAAREEIEVINSIYEGAATLSDVTRTVTSEIPDTSASIKLLVPLHYPDEPLKVSSVNGIAKGDSNEIQKIIDYTFIPGEVYMFTFIDEIKPLIDQWINEANEEIREREKKPAFDPNSIERWVSSDVIRDRGSTFVARCIEAHSQTQIISLSEELLANKKLVNASHNMLAWRIKDKDGTVTQSSENDGESGSGAVSMHLLEIADVQNAVVVVSRYFDGTHIGADRFKHIKNSAKDALMKGGFIKQ